MKIFQILVLILSSAFLTAASEPLTWSVNSRADVLRGDAKNVSIDSSGTISLAPKLTEIFKTDQPYVWSSVLDGQKNVYLGTGGDGKIFKIAKDGKSSLFADLAEMNVTALVISSNEIFAATSPDGRVYKIGPDGKPSVWFEPKEKYIWSLAVLNDGSLVVGTGESGKIYRVRGANASPEASVFFDSTDSHIISLTTDKNGNLYAGSDSNGIVLRFDPAGKPFGLLDSPLREIHEISVGPDGSLYVLALGESASVPAPGPTPSAVTENKPVTIARDSQPLPQPSPQKSRYDLTGAKSAVYRILPNGDTDILWSSPTVTAFSIHPELSGSGVFIGTSDKGRIYSISNSGKETLLVQTDTNQVSVILGSGNDIFAASSNQAKLFRLGPDTESEGRYESAVLDSGAISTWGQMWWRSNGQVQIETRAGNTERPDQTWSDWSNVRSANFSGAVTSPNTRYLQWRGVLKASSTSASLRDINIAFLPRNIAPEVLAIQVLPANLGLASNPPIQIDPNIELSGLDPQLFGIPNQPVPPRRIYQRAARAVIWAANDRNGDKLLYDVYLKEAKDTDFTLLTKDIAEPYFTIDGQSIADGRYVVKVVAKDSAANAYGLFLSGEMISEPFDNDNTQPTVRLVENGRILNDTAQAIFSASDVSSRLTRAEFSINGGPWNAVYAEDGISDSSEERYIVKFPAQVAGEYTVTLRVFDASGNSSTARTTIKR